MTSGIWNWLWWYIFGVVVGVGLTYLWFVLKDKVILKWFEWGMIVVSVLLLAFMIQTFFGSMAEWAPQAAWMSVGFIGLPIVVLVVITYRSVVSRIEK